MSRIDEMSQTENRIAKKLENEHEARLAVTLQKMKEAVTHEQVVNGKIYKGASFLCNPNKIIFKDFVAGEKYEAKFTITNISYSFSSFKIADINPAFRDFFEIRYENPGRMSAGTSLKFFPHLKDEINSFIPILTETGPLELPLICETKKCIINSDISLLDFGKLSLGQSQQRKFTLTNIGALSTEFQAELNNPLTTVEFTKSGKIDGYSSVTIYVSFTPRDQGELQNILHLTFSENVSPIELKLNAFVEQPNVYIDEDTLDFHITSIGCTYRDTMLLKNRGRVASHFQLEIPQEFGSFVDFVPKSGYVQVDYPSKIEVRFKPGEGILNHPSNNNGEIAIPVKTKFTDQNSFTIFIKATISANDLVFSPSEIDFGECPLQEAIAQDITITNNARITQHYGFVGQKEFIRVLPNDGFGVLLPQESRTITVQFQPSKVKDYKFNISCQTVFQTFSIPCKGIGFQPLIHAEKTLFQFGTVSNSDCLFTSTLLTNKKKESVKFNILNSKENAAKIFPKSGTIQAGTSLPIQIEFYPQLLSEHNKSGIVQLQLPCTCEIVSGRKEIFFFEVRAEVVPKTFDVNSSTLDFGVCSLGNHTTKFLTITNLTDHVIDFEHPVFPNSFFSLKRLRRLNPKASFTWSIRFIPENEELYQYSLMLHDTHLKSKTTILLKGQGVLPKLKIEPGNNINCGIVMAKESVKKHIKVKNTSQFSIRCFISLKRDGEPNFNRRNPFSVSPGSMTLASLEEREVSIIFSPDHESFNFSDTIVIETDTDESQSIRVEGFSSGTKFMFVKSESFIETSHQFESKFKFNQSTDKSNSKVYQLQFQRNGREPSYQTIEIGSKSDKKLVGVERIEYLIEFGSDAENEGFGFAVEDTGKGSLQVGQTKSIKLQFLPNETTSQRPEAFVKISLKCGQDSQIVNLNLLVTR